LPAGSDIRERKIEKSAADHSPISPTHNMLTAMLASFGAETRAETCGAHYTNFLILRAIVAADGATVGVADSGESLFLSCASRQAFEV
jgi:hypothetical protein